MQNDGTLAEQLRNEVIQHKGKCIDQNLQQRVLKEAVIAIAQSNGFC